MTEHVSAKLLDEGADHKKPRREDGPEPMVAVLSAAQIEELRKIKNRAKKQSKKENKSEAKALTEAANRLDEVAFIEAKAVSEEEERHGVEAASKKAKV